MMFMGNTQKSVAYMLKHSRAIPACAGRTTRGGPDGGNNAGHPRVCGEN